jgi:O-antigen biosynthesis protein WbqP
MYRGGLKRVIDVVAASAALLLLSPLMLILALAIRIWDPGPVIFRQRRVGAGGRLFDFYKFRSMPVNTGDIASDKLGEVRLSWIGRFIRRTNLDELPQLWNVVKGDMSLVGPRPPIPSQEELVELRRRNGALACRPGLTGLAQVNSFDGMSVAQKASFDGRYARSVSAARDAGIVVRTFGYLLKPPPKY